MGLLVEYTVHCDRLPLVDVATEVPEPTLRVAVGQPNQGGPPPFVLRASGSNLDALDVALSNSSFVADATLVTAEPDARRYRIRPARGMTEQLDPAVDDLETLRSLASTPDVVERVEVTPQGWRQRRRFADRAAFDAYRSFWQAEASLTLHRLVESAERDADDAALTDRQREALRTAHELGYFEVPRRASLEDVAAELDVSAASLSELLRRAQGALIDDRLAASEPTGDLAI